MAELPTERDFEDFSAWSGRDVVDADGERLGAIEEIFLDEATGVPEWVLVKLDDGEVFVPLAGAMVGDHSIRVGQPGERVAAAPRVEVGETLSVADEKRLYEHYGLEYSSAESSTVLPAGAGVERPRLKKYIGAPVPEPAAEEPTAEAPPAAEETAPAATPSAAAGETASAATPSAAAEETASAARPSAAAEESGAASSGAAADMAPRNLSSATPSELPPQRPQALPPEGGFQAQQALEKSTSKLRVASAVIAGAIAGLIAVLAFRRARR
jgi:sporulation protein YlmC with PRC-barrel domain